MHAFDVLADPVRRRLLELLAPGEQAAGTLTDVVRAEFGISQPAVSQHLKILREHGFAAVRAEGVRRVYTLDPTGLDAADAALRRLRAPLTQRLGALHTEIARGTRAKTKAGATAAATGRHEPSPTSITEERDAS